MLQERRGLQTIEDHKFEDMIRIDCLTEKTNSTFENTFDYLLILEEQARNNICVTIFFWLKDLSNMNDNSSPLKRRKVSQNVAISPSKLQGRRIVEHKSAAIGDGTVMLALQFCPDRPNLTEAYTQPAKKAIQEKLSQILSQEGFFLIVGLVGHTEVNENTDEPLRNTRGYLMKVVAIQSDEPMTADIRRKKLNVLTTVSAI